MKINEKEFICHSQQNDSIIYVKSLKSIYNKIDNYDFIENRFIEFRNKLEKGKTYSNGFLQIYLRTHKETEAWNNSKPKREYLETIKDTITKFLDIKVKELLKNTTTVDCGKNYYLLFSEKGKLIDIKTQRKLNKEERKCIKSIKLRLKSLKVDFVDPKYPFERVLNLYMKPSISIYDKTIY